MEICCSKMKVCFFFSPSLQQQTSQSFWECKIVLIQNTKIFSEVMVVQHRVISTVHMQQSQAAGQYFTFTAGACRETALQPSPYDFLHVGMMAMISRASWMYGFHVTVWKPCTDHLQHTEHQLWTQHVLLFDHFSKCFFCYYAIKKLRKWL